MVGNSFKVKNCKYFEVKIESNLMEIIGNSCQKVGCTYTLYLKKNFGCFRKKYTYSKLKTSDL